ncbi:MAG: DUF4157 domain-containing protein [Bacteroidetes bacterium]|jgi:hypothetical protein|nr:DUF4157 domain-containing protein [Bacteroidota bacterium]
MPFLTSQAHSSTPSQKEKQNPFFSKTASPSKPFFQPKLSINQPGDKYEKEADAMAEQVVQAESIQRQSAPEEEETMQAKQLQRQTNPEEEEVLQSKPLSEATIQRKCAECEEEGQVQRQAAPEEEELLQSKPLMRVAENGTATATPQLTSQLNSSKGGGQPLPKDTLSSMSQAFGTDFSNVRVHTGSRAQEMSEGIQAKAFTHGSDIYFNRGQYNPGATEGKRLLGHELTHVVQQNKSNKKVQREPATTITIGAVAAKCAIGAIVGALFDIGIQMGIQWWNTGSASFANVNYCSTILSAVLGCIIAPVAAYLIEPWIAAKLGPGISGIAGTLLGRILLFFAKKLGVGIPKAVVGKLLKMNCISEDQAVALGHSRAPIA